MPGQTPVFGIPYPTIGDTITPAVFQNFALEVETVVRDNQTFENDALHRPMALLPVVLSGGITVAVEFTVSYTITPGTARPFLDTDSFFNPGSPTNITIPFDGVYMIVSTGLAINGFATLTSFRSAIYKNGILQFAERRNENNGSTDSLIESIQGILPCAAGDVIQNRILWAGTGGPASLGLFDWPHVSVYRVSTL